MTLEAFLILCLTGAACYGLFVWIQQAVPGPDPWGPEAERALKDADAAPVCPHCLTPQIHTGWFCPECGATVGAYSNLLPMVYPFAIGEGFRAGVNGRVQRSALLIGGYVMVALGYLSLLAPVYLLVLFTRLHWAQPEADPPESPA